MFYARTYFSFSVAQLEVYRYLYSLVVTAACTTESEVNYYLDLTDMSDTCSLSCWTVNAS